MHGDNPVDHTKSSASIVVEMYAKSMGELVDVLSFDPSSLDRISCCETLF